MYLGYTYWMDKKFLYAVAVLVGSMVGVGIFGMPYAFAKAGYGVGILFLVLLGLATLLVDLMYGEVILRTEGRHQLFGYTQKYLGQIPQKLIFFSAVLTGYVGLLAYIIISGDFLNTLLSHFFYAPVGTYSIIFAIVLSLVVLRGLKTISWLELGFAGLYCVVVLLIFGTGFKSIVPANFHGFSRENFFLPYGVILFAFGGLIGLPIQRQILSGEERKFKKAILWALAITGGLYALFATTVVGISGGATTPDAISGLFEMLGEPITILGSLFGILAISTSFMMLASGLIQMFNFDFHIQKYGAWFLVVFPPLLLFLAGVRTFVDVISLAGGVSLGVEQILIVFLYSRAKTKGGRLPEYSLNIPIWLLYTIMAVLSAGVVYFLFLR